MTYQETKYYLSQEYNHESLTDDRLETFTIFRTISRNSPIMDRRLGVVNQAKIIRFDKIEIKKELVEKYCEIIDNEIFFRDEEKLISRSLVDEEWFNYLLTHRTC